MISEPNLIENEVSAMDRKGKKSLIKHYRLFSAETKSIIIKQNTELKTPFAVVKSNLSENEVNAMDVNCKIDLP